MKTLWTIVSFPFIALWELAGIVTYEMRNRPIWTCSWCGVKFARGGRIVWFPWLGRWQGHGMCATCLRRQIPWWRDSAGCLVAGALYVIATWIT